MVRELHRQVIILAAALVLAAHPHAGAERSRGATALTEKQYMDRITLLAKRHDTTVANKTAAAFFKAYPASPRIPDAWIILGDMETTPDRAIEHYRSVITGYKNYRRCDYARYRICEIHYLRSRWEPLRDDALPGTRLTKSRHYDAFLFFSVIALMHTEAYDRAEQLCRGRIESDHDYNNLARTLLILASIHKATTGHSRDYINSIREIAVGYGSADAMPAALFMLGDFYEHKRMYNESYSAYSDLISGYPGSPEAAEAAKNIAAVKRHNPRRVFYLPVKKIIDDTESLDISPEKDLPENTEAPVYYAISIGPFDSMKTVTGIKKELIEFDPIKTVRLSRGFSLYVGRCRDEDEALELRIRLAEEHGINGRIVRVSAGDRQSFIYGE